MTQTHFDCGHEATPENTAPNGGRGHMVCRQCRNAYQREWQASHPEYKQKHRPTKTDRFVEYRRSYLPQQIEAARRKVKALENEARRYGMTDLLEGSA